MNGFVRADPGKGLRILIYSRPFFPDVGGVESMALMLAEELTALGHRITVVTQSTHRDPDRFPFAVLRRPSLWRLLRVSRASDAILHMNVSLRAAWVLPFVRAAWVVAHGAQYRRERGRRLLRDHLKVWLARRALNIACSRAIVDDLPLGSRVIENAYDDRLFTDRGLRRDRDVLFVGRLVADKGVDLLLQALAAWSPAAERPTVSIVGDGPERERLERMCSAARLDAQVVFLGARSGEDLRDLMNHHRVLAVPSRVEPFGIVALEGLACGCAVVASDVGGLPEAVGRCGVLFASEDARALTHALKAAVESGPVSADERTAHLARFSRKAVATRYIRAIQETVARRREG